jgi:hypothetical protein
VQTKSVEVYIPMTDMLEELPMTDIIHNLCERIRKLQSYIAALVRQWTKEIDER